MCVRRAAVRSSGDEDECEKLEPSAMRFIPPARSSSFASMIVAPPQSSFTSDESVLLPRGTRFDLILHGDDNVEDKVGRVCTAINGNLSATLRCPQFVFTYKIISLG